MRLPWIAIVVLAAACGRKQPTPARSDRERDSTIAQSRLPNAGAVKAALKVSDSAAARKARLDSIAQ